MSVFVAHSSCLRRSGFVTAAGDPVADSTLIDEIAAGSEAALVAIYDRYSAMLYGMLVRILKDERGAEEILLNLFYELWRNPHRVDAERGRLLASLFALGRGEAISRLRGSRGTEIREEKLGDHGEASASPRRIGKEELNVKVAEGLRAALHRMPPEQREVLELAYFDGMSQSEIAASTGSPLTTVQSSLRMALQSWRRILEGGDPG